jgi:hypothetical protein
MARPISMDGRPSSLRFHTASAEGRDRQSAVKQAFHAPSVTP